MSTARLHVLYDPPARAADIVFVHGLEGHYKESWTNASSELWGLQWLSEDFYNVRILSYEYPNSGSFWVGHAMPIEQRCINFLESLYADNVGITTPVIFITHSMGGLLVKLALCQAMSSHKSRYLKLLEHTKGVVFYATPHMGSTLATWGNVLSKIFRASHSIYELQPLSEKLLNLNHDFGLLKIPSYSFGESKKIPVVGVVVEEFSGKSGLDTDVYIPVDEDHFSICKPHSRDAQTYYFTYKFIKEQFQSELENPSDRKELPKSIFHAPRDKNNNNSNIDNNNKDDETGMTTGTMMALAGTYLGMAAMALGVVAAVQKFKK